MKLKVIPKLKIYKVSVKNPNGRLGATTLILSESATEAAFSFFKDIYETPLDQELITVITSLNRKHPNHWTIDIYFEMERPLPGEWLPLLESFTVSLF